MTAIGVIPARMGSTRFPGKPLALLGGKPMIEHVYRRTRACTSLDEVLVATCDEPIRDAVSALGGRVELTSPAHLRASERVAEVSARHHADVVVMVQGDEPMVTAEMIDAALHGLVTDPDVDCVNLVAPIRDEAEALDPNTIKAVMSRTGLALYLSRSVIPSQFAPDVLLKQVCVIAFRRNALAAFAALPPGPLEQLESVDMLRFLENGVPVRLVRTGVGTHAVDTPQDLARVSRLMGFD
jgi:3-deoxy-manno-octulosonate cytidylyltransferase (CMP-KDO synthetase)